MVSAALSPDGTSRRALIAARARGTTALSDAVFDEIARVLSRPKFARWLDAARRWEMLEMLAAAAEWFQPTMPVHDCRDAKDRTYLELAAECGASVIVSGDDDLLVLGPWRGVRVVGPADFLRDFA